MEHAINCPRGSIGVRYNLANLRGVDIPLSDRVRGNASLTGRRIRIKMLFREQAKFCDQNEYKNTSGWFVAGVRVSGRSW